jgi:O-antigen ligase
LQEFTKNRLDFDRVNEQGELSGSSIQGNIRLLMMAVSFENAMKNPIIGNGPAAFTTQGMEMDHNKVLHAGDFAFDPSIVTTIFNDTGLIGVFLFLFFIIKFFSYIFKTFRENEDDILAKHALSFSIAIAGLLVAYIPSTALWIPFSWVYFSIPIALAISINNQRT